MKNNLVVAILIIFVCVIVSPSVAGAGPPMVEWEVVDQIPTSIGYAGSLALSGDGSKIYLVGRAGEIEMRDSSTFAILASTTLPVAAGSDSLGVPALTPDEHYLMVGDEHGDLYFLDPSTLAVLHKIDYSHRAGPFAQIHVTSDSEVAVASSIITNTSIYFGNLYFYDLTATPPVETNRLLIYGNPWSKALTPDNNKLYISISRNVVGIDRIIRIVDLETHRVTKSFPIQIRPHKIIMDAARDLAYVGSPHDPYLLVIDLTTEEPLDYWEIGQLNWLSFSPEKDLLVSSWYDHLKFISPASEEVEQDIVLPVARISRHAFSPDGGTLYVLGESSGCSACPGEWSLFILQEANHPPSANSGGLYFVDEGSSISLLGIGEDPDADTLTFGWDLDDNGTFETPGQSVIFSAAGCDGPALQVVALQVCDDAGACDTDTAEVEILNVPPLADAGPDQTVYRFDTVDLVGSWTDPASGLDDPYAWTWDLDGDGFIDSSGSSPFGELISGSMSFDLEGIYMLTFSVTDKDGGTSSDTMEIEVLNRPPVCDQAIPSIDSLWPVNHKFVPVEIQNVWDPEGDPFTLTIESIFQDEPLDDLGDGDTEADGRGLGDVVAEVRAERSGVGTGRFYHITFNVNDGHGGVCTGEVLVGVPFDSSPKGAPLDEGPLYDSTIPISE